MTERGLRPNGSRLSCGAELEGSQPEFYTTETGTRHGSRWPRAPPASSAC